MMFVQVYICDPNILFLCFVDEREIPNPPTNIQLSEEIDTRSGFFGHVILNISWDRPQSMHIHLMWMKLVLYKQTV